MEKSGAFLRSPRHSLLHAKVETGSPVVNMKVRPPLRAEGERQTALHPSEKTEQQELAVSAGRKENRLMHTDRGLRFTIRVKEARHWDPPPLPLPPLQ